MKKENVTIGMDLGDRNHIVVVLDETGEEARNLFYLILIRSYSLVPSPIFSA